MRSPDAGHADGSNETVDSNQLAVDRRRIIVKRVRECFHMLITAVICLMVSMVPGKNATAVIVDGNIASEVLSTRDGQMVDRFTQKFMEKIRGLWISGYLKRNRLWKKLFFWLQGPGDKKAASLLYRDKKTAFEVCSYLK